MKYKILALAVAAVLVTGCSDSDSDNDVHKMKIQAYDGPIANMDLSFTCGDHKGTAAATDGEGNTYVTDGVASYSPETCVFTFVARANSIDMSNGKNMSGVTYKIPKGLAKFNTPVTASPITTLVANQLGDAVYTEAAGSAALVSLGLGDLVNDGVSVNAILTDLHSVITKSTNVDDKALLASTTAVLSDVLQHSPDLDPTEMSTATKNVASSDGYQDAYKKAYKDSADGSAPIVDVPPVTDPTKPEVNPPTEGDKVPVEEAPTGGSGS